MASEIFGRFFGFLSGSARDSEESESGVTGLKMVIGLGNPGRSYAGTRHNIGFEVVEAVAGELGVKVKKRRFGGLTGEAEVDGTKLMLMKPQKYMNRSGQVVATAVGFYKLKLDNILVVTDDMALEPGRIRIRRKGSSGGHNGLADIISKLGSEEFGRLRVGIGNSGDNVGRDYVLSRACGQEREELKQAVEKASEAVLCWVKDGIDSAMNKYNV